MCDTQRCFQAYYSNCLDTTTGKLIHELSSSLRRPKVARRQDKQESGSANSDGSGLYVDYIFQNDNIGDESAFGYGCVFPDNLETMVSEQEIYTYQGYACMSILDNDNNASQGYIAISQDTSILPHQPV